MPEIETGNDSHWYPSAMDKDKNDDGNTVVVGRFLWVKRLDIAGSKEADQEVYRKVLLCHHKVIGDEDTSNVKIDTDNFSYWRNRFPAAWDAFCGQDAPEPGLQLAAKRDGVYLLDALTLTKIEKLRISGVTTFEGLARLDDATCQRLGFGMRNLREKAKEYLTKTDQPPSLLPGMTLPTAQSELSKVGAI